MRGEAWWTVVGSIIKPDLTLLSALLISSDFESRTLRCASRTQRTKKKF